MLNDAGHYEYTVVEYAQVARRQLVCALQVHVGVGDADRPLAVYNVARSYLPLLAALAANAPLYVGRDTGLASVRPEALRTAPSPGCPAGAAIVGTLGGDPRVGGRCPDAQSSVRDAIAIAAVTQALVAWLGGRHDAGEHDHVADVWVIEENRWSACRYGVTGTMADLRTSARRDTRECLLEQRDAARDGGVRAATSWLAERFPEAPAG